MMTNEIIKDLERLRREHHVCEGDCWYSCPLSDDECGGWDVAVCDCGADEHNAILDGVIEKVRAMQSRHATVTVELDATKAIKELDIHLSKILEIARVKVFLPDHRDYRYMWE